MFSSIFKGSQDGQGGVAGILITWSKEGKTSVAGGAAGILITWSKEGKTSVAGGRRLVTYNIAN